MQVYRTRPDGPHLHLLRPVDEWLSNATRTKMSGPGSEEKCMKVCFLRDGGKADAGDLAPVVGEVLGNNERGSSSNIICYAVGMVI